MIGHNENELISKCTVVGAITGGIVVNDLLLGMVGGGLMGGFVGITLAFPKIVLPIVGITSVTRMLLGNKKIKFIG